MAAGTPLPRAAPRWNAVQRNWSPGSNRSAPIQGRGTPAGCCGWSIPSTPFWRTVRVLWVQRHAEDVRRYPSNGWPKRCCPSRAKPSSASDSRHRILHPTAPRTLLQVIPGGKTGNLRVFSVGNWLGTGWKTSASLPNGAAGPSTASPRLPLQVSPLVPQLPAAIRGHPRQSNSIGRPRPWFGKSVLTSTRTYVPCSPPCTARPNLRSRRTDRIQRPHLPTALHPPEIAPCCPVRRARR